MKIAILTLPLHTNYGGILQAYALQMVLERMGHETVLLDRYSYYRELPWWKKPLSYTKRLIEKYVLKKIDVIDLESRNNQVLRTVRQHTQKFIDRYIHYVSIDDYSRIKNDGYDAIIVGSDQVWRPLYFGDNIEDAYLQFAQNWNVRRIAYAPSFGTDEWEYTDEQTRKCATLLARFNDVSVRETSAVSLCKKHFDIEAEWVLDPTMLLSMDDYLILFDHVSVSSDSGNLMVYILDSTNETDKFIHNMESKYGYHAFITNSRFQEDLSLSSSMVDCIQPPLEDWLRGFYTADFIITDSFHSCIFSLIFNKPFIVVGNHKRGNSRIDGLLEKFNQKHRLITDFSDFGLTDEICSRPNVGNMWESYRNQSYSYLLKALEE